MDRSAFDTLVDLRKRFSQRVAAWTDSLPGLLAAQRELARDLGEDDYEVQTPIVYNGALDGIGPADRISWIVVADNPGKNEQVAGVNRYLVGRSGKVAENFFNRELGVDFRREVLIINKTPVHTPKTIQLRELAKRDPKFRLVIEESQRFMAMMVPALQSALGAPVWIMGLSELRPKGIFSAWTETLLAACRAPEAASMDRLFLFNHFSMGSFATDLKKRRGAGETTLQAVLRIGAENRARILGTS